ncbi:MAG: hypothetical protein COB97_04115 [Paracoccus sp.]|nr:MAG: hypothetical protein COB97_04115 [Paracoccus sp. (in: a-proteobacteria)]
MRTEVIMHGRTETLATHMLDTFGMAPERSRELWRHVVDGTFALEGPFTPERGHRVKAQAWFLDELLLAALKAEVNVVNRTQDLIDRNPTPVVKVRMYRSGYSLLIHGDEQRTLGTGAIHFIDHDRAARQISTNHEQFTLAVPYHLLGYDPSAHPAVFSIGIDTPRGRILQAGLGLMLQEAQYLEQGDAAGLAAAVSGLLQGIVAGGMDSERDGPTRRARIAAMKVFIDKNLPDPDLGIDMLLKAFGASRATIYRDFAEDGGLQHYILTRRLQRAYRILSEAPQSRGAVQDAADRTGFATLAHFSRSFRDQFGERPSDVLGQWNQRDDRAQIGVGHAAGGSNPLPGPVAALQWAYKRFS